MGRRRLWIIVGAAAILSAFLLYRASETQPPFGFLRGQTPLQLDPDYPQDAKWAREFGEACYVFPADFEDFYARAKGELIARGFYTNGPERGVFFRDRPHARVSIESGWNGPSYYKWPSEPVGSPRVTVVIEIKEDQRTFWDWVKSVFGF